MLQNNAISFFTEKTEVKYLPVPIRDVYFFNKYINSFNLKTFDTGLY